MRTPFKGACKKPGIVAWPTEASFQEQAGEGGDGHISNMVFRTTACLEFEMALTKVNTSKNGFEIFLA